MPALPNTRWALARARFVCLINRVQPLGRVDYDELDVLSTIPLYKVATHPHGTLECLEPSSQRDGENRQLLT